MIGVVMLTVSVAVMLLACCIIWSQRQFQRRDSAQIKDKMRGPSVRLQVPRDTNTRRAMLRQAFSEMMTASTAEVAAWSVEERCFTATRNGYTQDRGDIELLQQQCTNGPGDSLKAARGPNRDSPSRGSFANHTPPLYHAAVTSPSAWDRNYAACTLASASASYGAALRRGRSRRENIDYAMACAFNAHGLPQPPRTPPRPSLRTIIPGPRSPRRVQFQLNSPLGNSPAALQLAATQKHPDPRPEATYELVPSRRYTDEDADAAGSSLCKDGNTVSVVYLYPYPYSCLYSARANGAIYLCLATC